MNCLLLTLKVFSATGGIEKVCRVAGKALYEMQTINQAGSLRVMSMHDRTEDAWENPYFPAELFTGFGAQKARFMNAAVQKGSKADTVIISHINLLPAGWLIKKVSPRTQIILFAHGIEIWGDISPMKRRMIGCCDAFICVSNFTSTTIQAQHGIPAAKCHVLNNCIDPFLPLPGKKTKRPDLMEQYGYDEKDTILFTLTRLSSKDRYKGYDKVFEALALLKPTYPRLRYLLGGGYDEIEKNFVETEIERLGLQDTVTIAGYLPEENLSDYFALADLYIMPSRKEGFGIVFIEAMYYGLPVIAGNTDGSVDALLKGKLGQLVDPESVDEIKAALENLLRAPAPVQPDKELLMQHFGYLAYKDKLENFLKADAGSYQDGEENLSAKKKSQNNLAK